KAGKRNAVGRLELLHERRARLFVRRGRDRVTVADAHEPALALEEACELCVLDLDRLGAELRLERGRLFFAPREAAGRSGPVQFCAAKLEAEEGDELARFR